MRHVVILLLLLTALAAPVGADHSAGECPWWPALTLPDGGYDTSYPVYVAPEEILGDDYVVGVWIYAEANGVEGLQRHDRYCVTEGWENPDLLLFDGA